MCMAPCTHLGLGSESGYYSAQTSVPTHLMQPRHAFIAFLLALGVLSGACTSNRILDPTSSTTALSLSSTQRILPLNGTAEITAVVVQPGGTPARATKVRFTSSLGRIDPAEVQTTNGVAVTTFFAGDTSGVAEVRAVISAGGTVDTSATVTLTLGAAATDSITIRATPSIVPATGGTVSVVATVFGTSSVRS